MPGGSVDRGGLSLKFDRTSFHEGCNLLLSDGPQQGCNQYNPFLTCGDYLPLWKKGARTPTDLATSERI